MKFRRHTSPCHAGCGAAVPAKGDTCAPCAQVDDWRKVLSFCTSAGDTLSEREALEVIRAIARRRIDTHKAALQLMQLVSSGGRVS
jgi:hypothetical protein